VSDLPKERRQQLTANGQRQCQLLMLLLSVSGPGAATVQRRRQCTLGRQGKVGWWLLLQQPYQGTWVHGGFFFGSCPVVVMAMVPRLPPCACLRDTKGGFPPGFVKCQRSSQFSLTPFFLPLSSSTPEVSASKTWLS